MSVSELVLQVYLWPECVLILVCLSLDRDVAERSILIKNMLEDLGESDEAIPIPNVSTQCLSLTLESALTFHAAGQ